MHTSEGRTRAGWTGTGEQPSGVAVIGMGSGVGRPAEVREVRRGQSSLDGQYVSSHITIGGVPSFRRPERSQTVHMAADPKPGGAFFVGFKL